jgi:hypothetical protein
MVKGGKLTKAELFYIEQNPNNLSIHELANELDRTPRLIAKHYIVKEKVESVETTQTQPETIAKPEAAMFKLMGRHERSGKHVATVMTKAASELSDATRNSRLSGKNKLASAIHKPLDN